MNKTAGLVLEMCGTGQAVEEIILQLQDVFPEQQENIRQDVETTVQSLLEHGALLSADQIRKQDNE